MNVLITGGMGYIGSHLAVLLSNQGHNVSIVDVRGGWSAKCNSHTAILKKQLTGNIYCYDTREDIFFQVFRELDMDVIFHFGEEKVIHKIETMLDYERGIKNSARNIVRLVNYYKRRDLTCKVVYASSGAVYGIASKYSKGKQLIENYLKEHIVDLTILRFGNPIGCIYGFNYKHFNDNALADKLISLVVSNEDFPLMTNENNQSTIRSYVFISALLNSCIEAITSKMPVIDVGSYLLETKQLVEEFLSYNRLGNRITPTPLRVGENFSSELGDKSTDNGWKFMVKYIV